MITWIKFTERQPEKEGFYLYWNIGTPVPRIAEWVKHRNASCFCHPERSPLEVLKIPDYWAEINPPVLKTSEVMSVMDIELELSKSFLAITEEMCLKHNIKIPTLEETRKEPPMPEKPLCKDCKWISGEVLIDSHAKCVSPKAPRSLVDGFGFCLCRDLRQAQFSSITCGPEGRWFESKEQSAGKQIICYDEFKNHVEIIKDYLKRTTNYPIKFTADELQKLIYLLDQL